MKNNKRLEAGDKVFQGTPGYHCSVGNENEEKEKLCLSDRMMRLLLHGLMVASAEIKHTSVPGNNIAKAMSSIRSSGFYEEEVQDLFLKDFQKIKLSTGFTDDDVSMGLHLAISSWFRSLRGTAVGSLNSSSDR